MVLKPQKSPILPPKPSTEPRSRQLWGVTRFRPDLENSSVVMTQEEFVCLIGGLDNLSTVMPDGSRVVSRFSQDLLLFIRFLPELHNKQALREKVFATF